MGLEGKINKMSIGQAAAIGVGAAVGAIGGAYVGLPLIGAAIGGIGGGYLSGGGSKDSSHYNRPQNYYK